jgi:hypothetical protein
VFHDTAIISCDELNLGTTQGPTTVATVGYSDLHYQEVQPVDPPLGELSREQLIVHALEERKVGQVLNTRSEDNCAESDEETFL